MDFIDQLKLISQRVNALKDQLQTEEATKMSFVIPFFQCLGYDVFNPLEFVPEYTADVGIKKGEKVDYAILNDGEPTILIEVKWCGEDLEKHGSQLFRYFSTTKAKFGILTNGIEYRFFTDLDESNKMDKKPFFTFNIIDLKDQDVIELKKFQKANFDVTTVFSAAEDLKYTNLIKTLLKKQFEMPDENFIKYLLTEVYDGWKTQNVVDKFQPIIKKSLNQFMSDQLNDRLSAAMSKVDTEQQTINKDNSTQEDLNDNNPSAESTSVPRIVTTQEELEGYAIVKAILHSIIPAEKITYRDTVAYFGILYDGRPTKWICRLKVESPTYKYIILPFSLEDGSKVVDGKKYPLKNVNSIFDYADAIKESAKRFTE